MRTFVLFLVVAALVATPFAFVQPAHSQESTSFELPGLEGEVTVLKDAFGVPRIYATTPNDLFMVQGYLHAQDRWWQMEWFRHQGAGRLAELAGPAYVPSDAFFRTLGINRIAEADLEAVSDDMRAILESYAAGVNAWIGDKTAYELALEYTFFDHFDETSTVEPWELIDTMVLVEALSLDQEGSDLNTELVRQGIRDAAGPLASAILVPPFPYNNRPIISEPGWTSEGTAYQQELPNAVATVTEVAQFPIALEEGVGSNSWVVSGEFTDTGMPYLANDPHIGIQMPAIWYMNGLHCVEVSAACPFDVYGYSFASSPLVVLGHNANIAWGWTNSGLDSIDVYNLNVSEENPLQYELDGEMQDMDVIIETIAVAGGDPIELPVRITAFGPVVSELAGIEAPIAARWVAAVEPARSLDTIRQLNTAANWDDFQAAAADFPIGQNFIYADVDGNIGIISAGRIPLRAEGHDGALPVDGTTSEFLWTEFLDPMENPRVFNPSQGYIVAANNAFINPADSPALISTYFDFGYRAGRIENRLQALDTVTMDDMVSIQNDNFNPSASFVIPVLAEITFADEALNDAAAWLGEWDYQNDVDSPYAALYNAFYDRLMALSFDELMATGMVSGDSLDIYRLSQMIENPGHPVWANPQLGFEERDPVIEMALTEALAYMSDTFGEDRSAWAWGDMHQANFGHNAFGTVEGNPFNRSIAIDGGSASVNNQRWVASSGNFNLSGAIVSMRMIVDFDNMNNSRFVYTLGQNGNPDSPHYDDIMPLWANGEYVPYGFTRDAADAITATTLTFTPSE